MGFSFALLSPKSCVPTWDIDVGAAGHIRFLEVGAMPKRSEKRDTAKAEYVARRSRGEEVNLRELAEQMGVNYKTLRDWKVKDKWDEAVPPKRGRRTPPGATRARRPEIRTRRRTELTAPSFSIC